jgi:hypothetical protein
MPKKSVPIDYTARDFNSIKKSLLEHAKKYYPETYKDFSDAGFGSLMMDTVAYIGDNLSFYVDYAANESYLDTAEEFNNILKLAKPFGYIYQDNPASFGIGSFFILVPSDPLGTGPDTTYLPILKKNSIFASSNGNNYSLIEDVHFSSNLTEAVVGRVDPISGAPISYALRAYGKVMSGYLTETYYNVGEYKKFLKIPVDIKYVTEITSVVDSEGNEYYEVDYLTQDVIYKPLPNRGAYDNNNETKAILKPFNVPRRFVKIKEDDKFYLQFGSGDADSETTNLDLIDPSSITLQMHGKNYVSDRSFDPNNLIKSDKMGLVPSNTILRIVARANTSQNVNTGANTLTSVKSAFFEFENERSLSRQTINQIKASLEVSNEEPIIGDVPNINSEELKMRVYSSFGAQNRAVTERDYESLCYSMPQEYGMIKRVSVVRDSDSFKRNLNIFIISENQNGKLTQANPILKNNLKTWLDSNKMINDTIDILDAKIVNLAISFKAVCDIDKDRFDVYRNAISALKAEYSNKLLYIGESFFISDIYTTLKKVDGLSDVKSVKIFQKAGGAYSDIGFDLDRFTSSDYRYIEAPKNVIFEIKYPDADIVGEIS